MQLTYCTLQQWMNLYVDKFMHAVSTCMFIYSLDCPCLSCPPPSLSAGNNPQHGGISNTLNIANRAFEFVQHLWTSLIRIIHGRECLAEMFATFMLVVCLLRVCYLHAFMILSSCNSGTHSIVHWFECYQPWWEGGRWCNVSNCYELLCFY